MVTPALHAQVVKRICPRIDRIMMEMTSPVAMSRLVSANPGWSYNWLGVTPSVDASPDFWYSVGVEALSSVEEAHAFEQRQEDYMHNKLRNPHNCDIVSAGLSKVLLVISSV
eukprot:TRINITY_DN5518_c0_g1_i2.p1 TRINITY_DN5518_c0_g1~~TRINITY_DN5518_c0_g1_i2.p1  ORF type:complete len:112 (+),score=15.89 TRINITY_DN5518_c0_g1_i2:127-462(+)